MERKADITCSVPRGELVYWTKKRVCEVNLLKKLLSIVLITIMAFISGCGAKTQEHQTSIYSWGRELFEDLSVMEQLKDYQIDRVYQGFYPADFEGEEMAELVSGLRKSGIETVALFGDPSWQNADEVIEWTLKPLVEYNKGVGKKARIDKVNYDIEWYLNENSVEAFADYVSVNIIATLASAILGAAVSSLYELIDTKGQTFITWFKSKFVFVNKDVYLSFSYLYKIMIDGKYLLIRGHRMANRYQPIGGVYKKYDEANPMLEKLGCQSDTTMGNVDETDDLRLHIKGKNVLNFIEWFQSMENREYDPTREFVEELIEPGLLPENLFSKLKYRKIHVHNVGFTRFVGSSERKNNRPEYIYSDIFELMLSDEQKDSVREAVRTHPNQLCLVSFEEIRARRFKGAVEMNIGNNAE